jgi:aspartate oxidase
MLIRQDLRRSSRPCGITPASSARRAGWRAHAAYCCELREDIQAFYRDCRPTAELIELRNAVQTALLVVHAAALNPISKGCHFVTEDEQA